MCRYAQATKARINALLNRGQQANETSRFDLLSNNPDFTIAIQCNLTCNKELRAWTIIGVINRSRQGRTMRQHNRRVDGKANPPLREPPLAFHQIGHHLHSSTPQQSRSSRCFIKRQVGWSKMLLRTSYQQRKSNWGHRHRHLTYDFGAPIYLHQNPGLLHFAQKVFETFNFRYPNS